MQKELTETLVSSRVAELAKKKGFSIKTINCFASFPTSSEKKYRRMNTHFSSKIGEKDSFGNKLTLIAYRPTQDLLQKWLREVHNIHFKDFHFKVEDFGTDVIGYFPPSIYYNGKTTLLNTNYCDTYEEAREEALFQALNLLPNKN